VSKKDGEKKVSEKKLTPNEKKIIFYNAAAIAKQRVELNYKNNKYDTTNWFPLGASYFGVKGLRGQSLKALKDFGFFSNYGGGVKYRMPSGQSANVGDQMADDFEDYFVEALEVFDYKQQVETFTDSWYN